MPGNILTANGTTPTYDTSGEKFGTAALSGGFGVTTGGSTAQISGPSGLSAANYTLKAWAKTSTAPSAAAVVASLATSTGSNIAYIGMDASGHFYGDVEIAGTDHKITTTATYTTGAWHELELDVSSTTAYFFVDGVLVGSVTGAFTYVPTQVSIGNYYVSPIYPWLGEVDEISIWPSVLHTTGFTSQSAAYVGTEGMTALYHLDSNLQDSSSVVGTAFAPNNAGIVYSPGNWSVTSGAATTIYGGAYFSTVFTGTGVALEFNVAGIAGATPELWIGIDGVFTQYTLGSVVTPTMPAANGAWLAHTLEVRVKGTSSNENRWTSLSFVALTAIVISGGSPALSATTPSPKSIWFIGDSITEGFNTISGAPNGAGTDDVDCKDSTLSWAYMQRQLLGVEVGVIGFSGQGLQITGDGGVPVLGSTLGYIYSGAARSFATLPALIHLLIGANDAIKSGLTSAQIKSYVYTYVQAVMALLPSVPIVVSGYWYVTYSGFSPTIVGTLNTGLQAAVAQLASPLVTYQDMTGATPESSSSATYFSADGLHPLGVENQLSIAPFKANLLRPLLFPAGEGRSYSFG